MGCKRGLFLFIGEKGPWIQISRGLFSESSISVNANMAINSPRDANPVAKRNPESHWMANLSSRRYRDRHEVVGVFRFPIITMLSCYGLSKNFNILLFL
jgi:hypothetical protein